MDEEYWASYRRRARRRASSQLFLILGPFMIAVSWLWFISPMDHPAGDIRDAVAFRLLVAGASLVFVIVGMVVSIRSLMADRLRD